MAKILMIIAPARFRDEELFVAQEEFVRAGHEVTIASKTVGTCSGSRGGFAQSEISLDKVMIQDYEAVVFVGGGGSKIYFNDPNAMAIARGADERGKVVGAICLAPVVLANAGILNGKRATVAGTEAKTLESHGAVYTGPGVTVDGNIITGNAPKATHLFALEINKRLA